MPRRCFCPAIRTAPPGSPRLIWTRRARSTPSAERLASPAAIVACPSACRQRASGGRLSPSMCMSCSRSMASRPSSGSAAAARSMKALASARWSSRNRRRWISRSIASMPGGGPTTGCLLLPRRAPRPRRSIITFRRWSAATCSITATRSAASRRRGRGACSPATWRRLRFSASRPASACGGCRSAPWSTASSTGEEIHNSERQAVFGPMAKLALDTLADDRR